MIVIADNSPLSALAEIGQIDVLKRLYGRIVIPASVAVEAARPRAPQPLRDWINQPPGWLQIMTDPVALLPASQGLGPGEAATISLAWASRG